MGESSEGSAETSAGETLIGQRAQQPDRFAPPVRWLVLAVVMVAMVVLIWV